MDVEYPPSFKKLVENITEEFQGRVKVGILEFRDNRRIASRFEIIGIPATILYKYKKEAVVHTYFRDMHFIMDFIRKEMKSTGICISTKGLTHTI